MDKRILTGVVLCILVLAVGAQAQNTDARIRKLESALQQMQTELAALKAQQAQSDKATQAKIDKMVSEAVQEETLKIPEWTKNIFNFTGDLRYRHNQQDTMSGDSSPDRRWDSVRGRFTLYGRVNDETDLILRFTSGTETLGGSEPQWADRDAEIDQMYADWHPGSMDKLPFLGVGVDFLEGRSPWFLPGQQGTHVLAGKMPFPFYTPVNSTLVFYPAAYNPEGIAATIRREAPFSSDVTLFATAGAFHIDEEATDGDASMWGFQTGATIQKPVEGLDAIKYATLALGYYDYGNIEEHPNWTPSTTGGNSKDANGKHLNDFNLLTVSGEAGIPICGVPVVGYGEYVYNTNAVTPWEQGYLFGVSVGEIKDVGDWQFTYNYRDIEKDAVPDTFNVGFGQKTDTKGHAWGLNYKLAKNLTLATEYFRGDSQVSDRTEDYDLWRIDVTFKF